MVLLPAVPPGDHQARVLQQAKMLCHRHSGHREPGSQRGEGLTVEAKQLIEQIPPRPVGQRFEDRFHQATIGNQMVSCQGQEADRRHLELICHSREVIDAKRELHEELQWVRTSLVDSLDGLSEYDVRRPLTRTGTNLLGLVKHLTLSEAVYLGDVFHRPFADPHARFDDPGYRNRDSFWVPETQSRADVVGGYQRACQHADATIDAVDIGALGSVPWWPRPDVTLFNVMAHVLTETNRHAGHADILREQLLVPSSLPDGDWAAHVARIEHAALLAQQQ